MASVAATSPIARRLVADAIAAEGPGYRNLADHVRCGGEPNQWIRFALRATDAALHGQIPEDDE